MSTYIALLRGINVGGHKKVPMADLRALHAGLGHNDVVTYIQSGNVVFDAQVEDLVSLRRGIEEAIVDEFGFEVPIMIRTPMELEGVMASSPYRASGAEPARLAVAFLAEPPASDRAAAMDPDAFLPDEFRLSGREVFLHCPTGFGRTTLTHAYLERQLGVAATIRGWKTVTKLAALADRR